MINSILVLIKKYPNIFVFIIFFVLTILMAVTLMPYINTHVPGVPGDTFQVLSNSYNLVNSIEKSSILALITRHPLNIFKVQIHLAILHKIIGQPLAYNIWWLSSFVLAAFFCYLLINYLIKNKIAAFVGGIVYSFAPTHFAYGLGFGGATHIEWIPLFVLFLFKYFYKPSFKRIILLAISFILVVINEPHFAAYSILLTIGIIIFFFITKREIFKNKKFIIYSLISLTISLFILFIVFLPLIKVSQSEQNYLAVDIGEIMQRSLDIASFITPFSQNALWGNFFKKNVWLTDVMYGSNYTKAFSEITGYIGFIVLFIIFFGVLIRKKNKLIIFWLLMAGIFSILALGPFLYFFGLVEPKIPLPYIFLLKYIPFFNNIRGIGRIFIIALLSIAILTGFGMKCLIEKRFKNRSKIILVSLFVIFIIIEYFNFLDLTSIKAHDFYKKLAFDQENYSLISIPGSSSYASSSFFDYYYSIARKKKIGRVPYARKVPGEFDYEKNTPVINELLYSFPEGREIKDLFIQHDFSNISNFLLNQEKVKYIVIDKNMIKSRNPKISRDGFFEPKNYVKLRKIIKENIETEIIVDDKELLVYKIKNNSKPKPIILSKGDNWNEEELDQATGLMTARMSNESTLILNNYSDSNKKVEIKIDLACASFDPHEQFKRLEIYLNDSLKNNFIIGPNYKIYLLYFDNIKPGKNIIKFKVYDENNKYIEPYKNKELSKTIQARSISYREIENIEIPQAYNILDKEKKNVNIIQAHIRSYFSFETNSLESKNINGKKIVDYDYFLDYLSLEKKDPFNTSNKYFLEYLDFYNMMPLVFNNFNFGEISKSLDILNQDYFYTVGNNLINKYKIDYLFISKKYFRDEKVINDTKVIILNTIKDSKVVYEDTNQLVYKINLEKYDPKIIKVKLDSNWGELLWNLHPKFRKSSCKNQCREIKDGSSLQLINDSSSNLNAKLNFTINTKRTFLDKKGVIDILDQNNKIYSFTINETEQNISLDLNNLKPGINLIYLSVPQDNNQKDEKWKESKIYMSNLSIYSRK